MQDFFEYLNKSIDINDEAKAFISSVIKMREFKKGDILITQGQSKALDNYFVFSGFLRSYIIDMMVKSTLCNLQLKIGG